MAQDDDDMKSQKSVRSQRSVASKRSARSAASKQSKASSSRKRTLQQMEGAYKKPVESIVEDPNEAAMDSDKKRKLAE